MRCVLLAAVALLLIVVTVAGTISMRRHETGWFAPVFSHDGRTVLVVRRDVAAWVLGFG